MENKELVTDAKSARTKTNESRYTLDQILKEITNISSCGSNFMVASREVSTGTQQELLAKGFILRHHETPFGERNVIISW